MSPRMKKTVAKIADTATTRSNEVVNHYWFMSGCTGAARKSSRHDGPAPRALDQDDRRARTATGGLLAPAVVGSETMSSALKGAISQAMRRPVRSGAGSPGCHTVGL